MCLYLRSDYFTVLFSVLSICHLLLVHCEGPIFGISVNGGWGPWSPYSPCSVSCGSGTMSHERFCNNPKPAFGGSTCSGDFKAITHCKDMDCPGRLFPNFSNLHFWCPFGVHKQLYIIHNMYYNYDIDILNIFFTCSTALNLTRIWMMQQQRKRDIYQYHNKNHPCVFDFFVFVFFVFFSFDLFLCNNKRKLLLLYFSNRMNPQ